MKKLLLSSFFLVSGILAQAQSPCTFSMNFTTDTASACPSLNDGAATVMVSGTTAPYTYEWDFATGGQTSMTASNLMPNNYSVVVTDSLGCADTGYVTVFDDRPIANICMVTTNSNSTYNVVMWDRTMYTTVDSFIVYREVSPGAYSRIGAVSNDSLAQFIDTTRSIGPANGDPNLASYRYKLQVLDTCGNYSALSLYHNTIYITDEGAGEFSWSIPYTIEGMPNPVTNYVLLCDTANVDVWGPVSTVLSTDTTAVDPGFATHGSIANWRVKTAWGIVCDPTRATVNTTRSNIKHASMTTGMQQALQLSASVLIYPNPATNQVSISLSPDIESATVRVLNMMGQEIASEQVNAHTLTQLDVSSYAKGMYTVVVEGNKTKAFKKLVIR